MLYIAFKIWNYPRQIAKKHDGMEESILPHPHERINALPQRFRFPNSHATLPLINALLSFHKDTLDFLFVHPKLWAIFFIKSIDIF